MMRVIAHTAGEINQKRAYISLAVLFLSLVMGLVYAVNLYSLISRTVAIKNIESKINSINSVTSTLDAEYLKLASTITPDAISSHGLKQGRVTAYITRPSPTASIINLASGGHEF